MMLKRGDFIMQIIKKIIFCAIIALIAISCDDSNEPWGKPSNTHVVIPRTCYAQTPLPAGSKSRAVVEYLPESWDESKIPATRTYAVVDPDNSSEYFQYWSSGDAISLFLTDYNLKYTMQSYKDGDLDIGIFELDGEAVQGYEFNTGYYYSVYPYKEDTYISELWYSNTAEVTYVFPELQHYNGDSYANGENGMVAIEPVETDSVLYFRNFCSYLQLRMVSDAGDTKSVKKITLTAKDYNDGISGEGWIELQDENTAPVITMSNGATNQITLDCGSGVELSQDTNNPSLFWFVLPGDITFTQGFTVTVVFNDNSYFRLSTSKQISIARSHIKPMATFKPTSVEPNRPIRYKYNDTSIDEPYPLNNTFYGENGEQLDIVDQVYDETTGEWVVLLAGTLKEIGGNSFEGPGPDIEYIKIDNEESIYVDEFAFYNCTADFIEINNDVEEIKESAFTGSTVRDLNINGNVTSIKNSAGTGSSIENITVTGNVEIIEEQAFSGCDELQTVNVGSVETIGYRAFYMCKNLTEVNVPGAKYVEAGAFRQCTSLETITLDSVVTIDDNAFMDCSKLTSVVISENCTMIGEGAFCNAVSLRTVYCHAVTPPFIKTDNDKNSYVFDNTNRNIRIYIPVGSMQHYLNKNIFVGNTYDDPKVKAEVNWWYQECRNKLVEKQN